MSAEVSVRVCSTPGCGRPHSGKDLCLSCYGKKHYRERPRDENGKIILIGSPALIGTKVGRLTVLAMAGAVKDRWGKTNRTWLCQCDCGNRVILRTTPLRAATTRSCGCLRREVSSQQGGKNADPLGKSFNQFVRMYRINAKNRGLAFDLTRDEVADLSRQPCFYCGDVPVPRQHRRQDFEP
jgi:hypothetical protein